MIETASRMNRLDRWFLSLKTNDTTMEYLLNLADDYDAHAHMHVLIMIIILYCMAHKKKGLGWVYSICMHSNLMH